MLCVAQPSFISLFRLTVWILSSIDSGEKKLKINISESPSLFKLVFYR